MDQRFDFKELVSLCRKMTRCHVAPLGWLMSSGSEKLVVLFELWEDCADGVCAIDGIKKRTNFRDNVPDFGIQQTVSVESFLIGQTVSDQLVPQAFGNEIKEK